MFFVALVKVKLKIENNVICFRKVLQQGYKYPQNSFISIKRHIFNVKSVNFNFLNTLIIENDCSYSTSIFSILASLACLVGRNTKNKSQQSKAPAYLLRSCKSEINKQNKSCKNESCNFNILGLKLSFNDVFTKCGPSVKCAFMFVFMSDVFGSSVRRSRSRAIMFGLDVGSVCFYEIGRFYDIGCFYENGGIALSIGRFDVCVFDRELIIGSGKDILNVENSGKDTKVYIVDIKLKPYKNVYKMGYIVYIVYIVDIAYKSLKVICVQDRPF